MDDPTEHQVSGLDALEAVISTIHFKSDMIAHRRGKSNHHLSAHDMNQPLTGLVELHLLSKRDHISTTGLTPRNPFQSEAG